MSHSIRPTIHFTTPRMPDRRAPPAATAAAVCDTMS